MSSCVLGASLDVGNRGVRALAVSTARLLSRVQPGERISFHYGHPVNGSRRLPNSGNTLEILVRNCRMSLKSAPSEHILVILALALLYRIGLRSPARRNPWLRSLLDAEFIGDIRGGDSFSDIYGFRRFFVGSLPLLTVALLGREYTLLPQTYGPFKTAASRRLAQLLLRRADRIVTRDRNCAALVEQLCGRVPMFCPDVAFTLEPVRPATVAMAPAELDLDGNRFVIGVNVSGLLYMGGYTGRNMFGLRTEYKELIDRLIEHLLSTTDATIVLVPHVFGSEQEQEASSLLLETANARHPGRVFSIAQPLTEQEIKWVIGRTHFFIGSRMHACIAALSQFVPAAGLAYSDKFLGVFESAGVGEAMIDLRTADVGDVLTRTSVALQSRAQMKERLQSHVPGIQEDVLQMFRGFVSGAAQDPNARPSHQR